MNFVGYRAALGAVAVVVGAVVIACGGSGGGGGGSGDGDQACEDFASAVCMKLDGCSSFLVQGSYGDVATCTSRAKAQCVTELTAPSTGQTASHLESCASALAGLSCDDVLDNDAPSACQPSAGQLAAGAACIDSSQCASTYCNLGTGGTCGACGNSRSPAGAACNRNDDCNVGLLCNSNVCAAPVAVGGTCDATHPCQALLVCKSGACAMPDEAGAACTTGTCDSAMGLYCSTAGVCTALDLVAAGQTCGDVNDALVGCSASGTCKRPSLTAATGTCESAAADGATCNASTGPSCLPPAVCSAAGVCTLPSSTCM